MVQWINSKDRMPIKDSPMGFLVVIEKGYAPLIAHFDEMAKRFTVYAYQVGRSIHTPVVCWMEIPLMED